MIWLWLGVLAALYALANELSIRLDAAVAHGHWFGCDHDCNQGRRCRCGGAL